MITRKMRKAMKAVAKANGITEAQAVTEIENISVVTIKKQSLKMTNGHLRSGKKFRPQGIFQQLMNW